MTSGGLRTSSEVERLVPGSHSAAEEEEEEKTVKNVRRNTQVGTTSSPAGVSTDTETRSAVNQ